MDWLVPQPVRPPLLDITHFRTESVTHKDFYPCNSLSQRKQNWGSGWLQIKTRINF
jgi:hypothetical protein